MTAVVRSRDELLEVARARAIELNTTRPQIDEAAGFAAGYASKILSFSGARSAVSDSFFELLWSLGLRVRIEDDPEALKALQGHYKRKRRHYRYRHENSNQPTAA
jgi:hypothetical protein